MAKPPSNSNIPPEILESYARLVSTIPGLERKGDTMPYTSLNGHMFSFLNKSGILNLRLPREARENFLTRYNTSLSVENETVLKEYVSVPGELLASPEELKNDFLLSYEYVKSLKPKPTKKAKTA